MSDFIKGTDTLSLRCRFLDFVYDSEKYFADSSENILQKMGMLFVYLSNFIDYV